MSPPEVARVALGALAIALVVDIVRRAADAR